MRRIQGLKQAARKVARSRGHDVYRFIAQSNHSAIASCKKCGMIVVVRTNPAPNDIDISGEAVGLNCSGQKVEDICQTKQDARNRILQAQIGGLVNPTEEYLLEMHLLLLKWTNDVFDTLVQVERKKILSKRKV